MFQIDRSYIDHVTLETLQGHIWDIRTDHKDDPTLPKLGNYQINSEEAFEQYLEKRQKFEDFKESWLKYRMLIFGLAYVIPVALFSLLANTDKAFYAYVAGLLLCLLIYLIYTFIKSRKEKKFRNNPYETFINDLLSWEQTHSQS